MQSFIEEVLINLKEKKVNFSELTFILPSKRSGVFLKHSINNVLEKTSFSPEILSIEEFIETLSELKYASNTELLFEFYEIYLNLTPKTQIESFDSFSKWAQLLLQDFNEIDRYLVAPNQVFEYLSAIKEIEHQHWSLDEQQTPYIKNYLSFWKRLKVYYAELNKELIHKKKGYQGLVYREAVENLEQFIALNNDKSYVFVGFNALNKAEEIIIQEFLEQDIASIYWDIDHLFFSNPIHDAGLFLRSHRSKWHYFKKHDFNWITKNYASKKNINCFGVPKNIGQIKYVGELLKTIKKNKRSLQSTAIVLGEESLLLPLLNSIPKDTGPINITMGLPLRSIPLASLFETLFKIHKSPSNTYYYKDIILFLSNQFIKPLFVNDGLDVSDEIISTIQQNNKTYLTLDELLQLSKTKCEIIELMFGSWENSSKIALKQCSKLILIIKNNLDQHKQDNLLGLEYLYRFNIIFNELLALTETYTHITNITTLYGLFKELLKNETLDFKGEPLKGLQIMGMLESRVLDFETVIITSVNEGILPAGKSNNSFIPFDVKLQNEMPTYKEKDAVYTYHFYRLLQRAKNIYILYNTEPDVLNGGEKSRFITQLEIEKTHIINRYHIAPVVPEYETTTSEIEKTNEVTHRIKSLAKSGFSPSSLTNYVRNPIAFYYEKVLGVKQFEDVEESIALNTLGTVIHNTLEDFYKPLEGNWLTLDDIDVMHSKIDTTVLKHFEVEYKQGDITRGKNLIIFEISKRYIFNFLNLEAKALREENTIKIIAIETEDKIPITIEGFNFPINITGKVDRVDEYNGNLRIIDYKSGRVEQSKVEVVDWEDLTSDYDKYSKSFQVLTYVYMMFKSNKISLPVEAGIISFKNLSSGFIKFAKKDTQRARAKDHLITKSTLDAFEVELKKLISEICDPKINFIEKDI
ncbi:PD-(D/E)XK nuclease family protein [uncultured Psychroserpens sp.]|uniref:PD-(D/E)XK nuclease family protein n=1 Tax=uncultured Psychroserpens sp. TaxID=255436 RepID=UPI002623E13F|nr:PD-(D/E)XK nuclease family protein [uncultured Psychroserpens sp.]